MNKKLKNILRNSWLRVVGFYIIDTINCIKYNLLKQDLVLVYQMGKVASSSIYNSLKKMNITVYQIHRFNKDYIQEVHRNHKEKTGTLEAKIVDERGMRLYNIFIKKNKRPIFIISLIRDPIERNISAFFQNKEHFTKHNNYSNIDELINLFYELYDHETPLKWFDKEFRRTLDVNIYDYPFLKEKKFSIIKSNNFNILLMRIDLEDSLKEKIISDFLDLGKAVKLKNKNIGHLKAYNSQYTEFKNKLKLNENYVNSMLESRFVEYFYTEEEIRLMKKRWLN